jgi:WD40 repeat protein
MLSLNDHTAPVKDFKWSNIDPTVTSSNQGGYGFIVTLSSDMAVRLYDIARTKAECLMTLRHQSPIGSLSLSHDNSFLAVGGQTSEIFIWSLKDQKLVLNFFDPSITSLNQADGCNKAVCDINWSNDGTFISAGYEDKVVMLDMRLLLTTPVEILQQSFASVQGDTKSTKMTMGGYQSGDFGGLNGNLGG